MKDYYAILGVRRFSSLADVKKGFRRLALKHHPDRGGSTAKMQELNEAYTFLMNNKLVYDGRLNTHNHGTFSVRV